MIGGDIKAYVGDINGGSLMLSDSLILAPYLLDERDKDQWKKLIVDQNILQRKSAQTALRAAATVRKRLLPLGSEFLNDLVTRPERTYIQLLMLALLIESPIMVDFMQNVVSEARRRYKPNLDKNAWDDFLEDRCRSWPELRNFSDETYKKIGKNIIRALAEAGYIDSATSKRLQPVFLVPDVRSWLTKLGRTDLIPVMECTF